MAVDPTTGQPYDIGPNTGQWIIGQQQFGQTSGSDGAQPIYSPVGRDGINPQLAASVGYTPPGQNWGGVDSGNQVADPAQDFADFLAAKGLHLGQKVAPGTNQAYQQVFDANNNPVGQQYNANLEQDPGGIFAAGVMGMAGFGAASAAGAFGAASGAGSAVDGAGGMSLAEGATPASLTSGTAAGTAGGTAAGTAAGTGSTFGGASGAAVSGGATSGGTGLFGTGYSLQQIAGAANTAYSLAGKMTAGGASPTPTGASIAGSLIAGGGTLYSAIKAGAAQDKSVSIQENSAAQQAQIAQDQWDYHKNIYLPEAEKQANTSIANTNQAAVDQKALGDFNSESEKALMGQGQKSFKYQDEYMGLTDKYASGQMANTMADEGNADVQQGAAQARLDSEAAMQRRGINASSGAGMAMMADTDRITAANAAGAQTAARRAARDKAEAMIATAAAGGTQTMGLGINAGNLASGAYGAGVTAAQAGNTTLNGVGNTLAYGANAAAGAAGGAGKTGYTLGQTYGGSLPADAISGMAGGAVKSGLVDAFGNMIGGSGSGAPASASGSGLAMPQAPDYTNGSGYGGGSTFKPSDNYGDGLTTSSDGVQP